MTENKQRSETELMALPPLRMVLDDLSFRVPEWHSKTERKPQKPDLSMEDSVKRLIAHFKDVK